VSCRLCFLLKLQPLCPSSATDNSVTRRAQCQAPSPRCPFHDAATSRWFPVPNRIWTANSVSHKGMRPLHPLSSSYMPGAQDQQPCAFPATDGALSVPPYKRNTRKGPSQVTRTAVTSRALTQLHDLMSSACQAGATTTRSCSSSSDAKAQLSVARANQQPGLLCRLYTAYGVPRCSAPLSRPSHVWPHHQQ